MWTATNFIIEGHMQLSCTVDLWESNFAC